VILWAHNSHLGDARQTDAGQRRGEWNVGQLIRERFGLSRTFNIGFSTYTGTVTASKSWDKPANCQKVRNGMFDSYEHVLHNATENWEHKDYYLLFRSNNKNVPINVELVDALMTPRLERYIGVIYRSDTEKASHYCKATFPKEYDSVIYLDKTSALHPIDPTRPWEEQHSELHQIQDNDNFPELDPSTSIPDSMWEWRLWASKQINEVGMEYLKHNDYQMAITKFDKALHYVEQNLRKFQTVKEITELRIHYMLNRADAYFKLKLWSGVIRDCSTVLNLNPNDYKAHILLGKAYEEKGQDSVARHHFDIAAKQVVQELETPASTVTENRR